MRVRTQPAPDGWMTRQAACLRGRWLDYPTITCGRHTITDGMPTLVVGVVAQEVYCRRAMNHDWDNTGISKPCPVTANGNNRKTLDVQDRREAMKPTR